MFRLHQWRNQGADALTSEQFIIYANFTQTLVQNAQDLGIICTGEIKMKNWFGKARDKPRSQFDASIRVIRRTAILLRAAFLFWRIRMLFLKMEIRLAFLGWIAGHGGPTEVTAILRRAFKLVFTTLEVNAPYGKPGKRAVMLVRVVKPALCMTKVLFVACCAAQKRTRRTPQPVRYWCRVSLYRLRCLLRVQVKFLVRTVNGTI